MAWLIFLDLLILRTEFSLAESRMRVLRRLDQNRDGFRTEKGRQKALKIYQAGAYLG